MTLHVTHCVAQAGSVTFRAHNTLCKWFTATKTLLSDEPADPRSPSLPGKRWMMSRQTHEVQACLANAGWWAGRPTKSKPAWQTDDEPADPRSPSLPGKRWMMSRQTHEVQACLANAGCFHWVMSRQTHEVQACLANAGCFHWVMSRQTHEVQACLANAGCFHLVMSRQTHEVQACLANAGCFHWVMSRQTHKVQACLANAGCFHWVMSRQTQEVQACQCLANAGCFHWIGFNQGRLGSAPSLVVCFCRLPEIPATASLGLMGWRERRKWRAVVFSSCRQHPAHCILLAGSIQHTASCLQANVLPDCLSHLLRDAAILTI